MVECSDHVSYAGDLVKLVICFVQVKDFDKLMYLNLNKFIILSIFSITDMSLTPWYGVPRYPIQESGLLVVSIRIAITLVLRTWGDLWVPDNNHFLRI